MLAGIVANRSNRMNPITEDDIANFLYNTPDFFSRHAELLAAVQLTSPHSHRAISLQERQAEMLREKIKQLELKMADFIRHGRDSGRLDLKLEQWAQVLLRTRELAELPAALVADLCSRFAVPAAALRLWGVADPSAPYAQGVSDGAKSQAAALIKPYVGPNTGFEAVGWLDDPAAVQSIALMPLRLEATPPAAASPAGAAQALPASTPVFGLLVLASPDAQRFDAELGTDFLSRLSALAAAALSRLLA
jgi:uncharacterized protein YigA (DUF484 family)